MYGNNNIKAVSDGRKEHAVHAHILPEKKKINKYIEHFFFFFALCLPLSSLVSGTTAHFSKYQSNLKGPATEATSLFLHFISRLLLRVTPGSATQSEKKERKEPSRVHSTFVRQKLFLNCWPAASSAASTSSQRAYWEAIRQAT